MDFGIGETILSVWVIWNFWSIVPVVIIMAFAVIIWRFFTVPQKGSMDRIAYDQDRDNKKLLETKARRYSKTAMIYAFVFMGSVFFCISIFKMFTE